MEATRSDTTGCSYTPYISILPAPMLGLQHIGYLKEVYASLWDSVNSDPWALPNSSRSGKPAEESYDPDSGHQGRDH